MHDITKRLQDFYTKKTLSLFLCVLFAFCSKQMLVAQCTYKFTNGGGNNEWSNISNWTLVAGGCAVSAVPGLSDDVIIDVDVIAAAGVGVLVPNRINISNATSGAKSITLIGSATGKGLYFQTSSKLTVAGDMDLSGIGASRFTLDGGYLSTLSFTGPLNTVRTNNNHFRTQYTNFEAGSNYQLQDSLLCTETTTQNSGLLNVSSNFNSNGNHIICRYFSAYMVSVGTGTINISDSHITGLGFIYYAGAASALVTNTNTGVLATDSALSYAYNYPAPGISIYDNNPANIHAFGYLRFKAFRNQRLEVYDRGGLTFSSCQVTTNYFGTNMSLYCTLPNFTATTFEVNNDATIGFNSYIPAFTPIINIGTLKKDAGCNSLAYFEAYFYHAGYGMYYHTQHVDINLTNPSTVDYCAFRGIRVSGAALTANNSFDLQLNSGITFASTPASRTLAWTGGGGLANNSWNNSSNWTDLTSGFACIPNYNDSVVFDDAYMTGNRQVAISHASMCGAIKINSSSSLLNFYNGAYFSSLVIGRGFHVDPINKNVQWANTTIHFVSEKRGNIIDMQNIPMNITSYFYGHGKWNFVSDSKIAWVNANQGYLHFGNSTHEYVSLKVLGPLEIGAADTVYADFATSHLKLTYGYLFALFASNNHSISNAKLIKGSSLIEFTSPAGGAWFEGITKDVIGNPNYDLWNLHFSSSNGQSSMYFYYNSTTKDPVSFNKVRIASELFTTTYGFSSTTASLSNPDKNYMIADSIWIDNGGKLFLQDGGSVAASNNNSIRVEKAIYVDAACTAPYGKILSNTSNMANINGPGTLTSNKIIFTNVSANSNTGVALTSANSILNNSPNWIATTPASQVFYWNGEGITTNWSEYRNWNVSTPPHVGTADDASAAYNPGHCIPSLFDSVIFTAHAFPLNPTVTINQPTDVKSIYWDSTALNTLYAPSSLVWNDAPNASLNIYSSLQMSNHALPTYTAPTTFYADDDNNDLKFSSRQFLGQFIFDGNGTWFFKDSLYLGGATCASFGGLGWSSKSGLLELKKGKLNTQHHNINANAFYSSLANNRTLDIRQSKVTLRAALYHYIIGPAYVQNLEMLSDNLILKADSSTIKIINSPCMGRTAVNIRGATALNFNIIDFYGVGSLGNEFYSNIGSSFKRVTMDGNCTVYGASFFDTLKLKPMTTNTFESGKTQIIDSLVAVSNNCVQMILQSSTVGSKAILCDENAALGEHLIVGFADLKDIKSDACGGPNSEYFPVGDASTSLGWVLNNTILNYGFLLDSVKLSCKEPPSILSSSNFYPGSSSTYAWTSSALSGTISTAPNYKAIQTGWYKLNVGYTPICFYEDSIYVKITNNMTSSYTVTPVKCNAENNGAFNYEVTADTSFVHDYLYTWQTPTPSTNTIVLNTPSSAYGSLVAGIYTLTVQDTTVSKIQCVLQQTVNIPEPNALLTGAVVSLSIACYGNNTGALTSNPTGGNGGYAYLWEDGATTYTTQNISNVPSNVYSITVVDSKTCTVTNTLSVNQPTSAVSVSSALTNSVLCFGGNTGDASVVAAGGTPAYTYSWTGNASTTNTATGLSVGDYTATITDANNCTVTQTFAITQPASAVSVSSTNTNSVACFGGSTGGASLTATGGTPVYTYSWTGNASITNTATGLFVGNYTATVTDANNCIVTQTFSITQPVAALSINTANTTSISCFGGSNGDANLTAIGGTPIYTYSWTGNASITNTATNLSVGDYTATVTDANNCIVTQTFSVVQPTGALSVSSINTTSVSCFGGNNGDASLTATGGTPIYTYSWTGNASITNTATGLSVGDYTATITDANNCVTTQSFAIAQPTSVVSVSSISTTSVACFGASTGDANLTATGGTPIYTYSWTGNASVTNTATGLSVGDYTATITDANNCTATQSFAIVQPTAALVSSITNTTQSSCGTNNGSATITATGGTSSYTYSWTPPAPALSYTTSSATTNSLGAGNNQLTIIDANGCLTNTVITISNPNSPVIAATINSVSCFGGSTGSITTTVSIGTPTYSYAWSDGSNSSDLVNVLAGDYTLTVTDASNCNTTQTLTIMQPTIALSINSISNNSVSCFGGNNGDAILTATGGTPIYTYSWTGNASITNTATGLSVGDYTATITDANNCVITQSFAIAQPTSAVSISSINTTSVSCFAASTGDASLIAIGGTPVYNYSWTGNASITNTATGLSTGNYTATVTDANNCVITQTFAISQPTSAVSISVINTTSISCFGGNTGDASLTAIGGTPVYSYSWTSNASISNTATGLSVGDYTATVTDANNCVATQSFAITQPTAVLSISSTSSNSVLCFGGNTGDASLTATGGTPIYTYSWTGNTSVTNTATGLSAGNYTATITDANNCIATQSFAITQPTVALSISSVNSNSINCFGASTGSTSVVAIGGTPSYSYAWVGSALTTSTLNNLPAGDYTVTVTDFNQCIVTQNFSLFQPANPLIINSSLSHSVSCFGGSTGDASITASGGTPVYSYSWTSNTSTTNTAIGLSLGNYTATVTDVNNCIATQTFAISQPTTAVSVSSINTNSVGCFGASTGDASLTATGGTPVYTYSWTSNASISNTAIGLSVGDYTATVMDANNCIATQSFAITQPTAALSISSTSSNSVLCFGGNTGDASLTATGGTPIYSYSWTGNASVTNTATGLSAGNYTATITDANNCTVTQTVNIAQPIVGLSIGTMSTHSVSCFSGTNGDASITAVGGTPSYSYSWTGNTSTTTTAINLSAGNYTVIVTDANSCIATQTLSITQPTTALACSITSITQSNCGTNNGSASVLATGGTPNYTYSWTPPAPLMSYTTTSSVTNSLGAGINQLIVIDANGCLTNTTITITNPNSPVLAITINSVSCFGANTGVITTTVSVGTPTYSYLWSNGSISSNLTNAMAGTYTLIVTDASNCIVTQTAMVNQPNSGLQVVTNSTGIYCFGQNTGSANAIATGGTPAYSYTWQPGNTISSNLSNVGAGNYTVIVSDGNGCLFNSIATVVVTNTNAVIAIISSSVQATCEEKNGSISVTATGGTPQYNYLWMQDNTNNPDITNIGAGTYTVIVIDSKGCRDTLSIVLDCKMDINVPQLFSPNGDGKNDKFIVKDIEKYPHNELSIFNRWGSLVYRKTQYNNDWDGTANVSDALGNDKLPAGTYYVVLEFGDGQTKPYHGYVQLQY